MRAQLTRKWQTEVYAANACESGYGAVTADIFQQLVSAHGRVSERSRFRRQRGGKSAREHALWHARISIMFFVIPTQFGVRVVL